MKQRKKKPFRCEVDTLQHWLKSNHWENEWLRYSRVSQWVIRKNHKTAESFQIGPPSCCIRRNSTRNARSNLKIFKQSSEQRRPFSCDPLSLLSLTPLSSHEAPWGGPRPSEPQAVTVRPNLSASGARVFVIHVVGNSRMLKLMWAPCDN